MERSWEETGERRHHQNIFNEFSIKKKTKKELVLIRLSSGCVSLELSWSLSQCLGYPDSTVFAIVSYFIESLK